MRLWRWFALLGWRVRALVALAGLSVLLAGCAGSSQDGDVGTGSSRVDRCVAFNEEAEQLAREASDAESKAVPFLGPGWEKWSERQAEKTEELMRLLVNQPDCFTNYQVGQAQKYFGFSD